MDMQGKDSPKILVGIMHVNQNPWLKIAQDGQIPSWKESKFQNFSVIYFFSLTSRLGTLINQIIESLRWSRFRFLSYLIQFLLMIFFRPWIRFIPKGFLVSSPESKIDATALKVRIPELFSTMRWKKLVFLKYFLEKTSAEFVIISNSSSILNFDPILEFLNDFDNNENYLYAGKVHQNHKCGEYASGSYVLLNRRSAALLLENTHLIPVHAMDDVVFGMAFNRFGISPISLKSFDFDSVEKMEEVPKEELRRVGHFRLKSGPLSERNDVEIMRELCNRLYS